MDLRWSVCLPLAAILSFRRLFTKRYYRFLLPEKISFLSKYNIYFYFMAAREDFVLFYLPFYLQRLKLLKSGEWDVLHDCSKSGKYHVRLFGKDGPWNVSDFHADSFNLIRRSYKKKRKRENWILKKIVVEN